MDLVTKIPIVTDEGDVVIFGDLIGPDGFTLGIGDEDSSETIMTFGADEVSFSDKVGIGGAAGSAKLAVVGGYLDIILTGKDGLGESGVLQTKSDGKTIGDALGWNFNLRGSNDASANYAKLVIGITDPTAGALKGYFSIHTVGAIDGIVERFRVNDVGLCNITGDLTAGGGTFTGVVDASAGGVLTEDNATEAPTDKDDGYIGLAKIGADGRIYFTVEGEMYYVDGTIVSAAEIVTGNPIGLLLALTYNLE